MHRSHRHPLLRKAVRFGTIYLLLPFLALLTARLIWGYQADHHLTTVREELRVRSLLPVPRPEPIPDEQNAATAIIEAIRDITLTPEESNLMTEGDENTAFADIVWTDAHLPDVRRILANNQSTLQLIEVAAERPLSRWPVPLDPVSKTQNHPLLSLRQLANLLYDAAIIAHQDHLDRETFNDLRLILALSRIADEDPSLFSHVVASALRSLAANGVERFEHDTRLIVADGSLPIARSLLANLSDTHSFDDRLSSWAASIDNSQALLRRLFPDHTTWIFEPLLIDETARMMQNKLLDVPSLRADNWQDVAALIPRVGSTSYSYLDNVAYFSYDLPGDSWSDSKLHFRTLASSAAAALLVAAKIFEAQTGHLPVNAQELVPTILQKLPVDPYAPDHRPMRYRLDADGPTVWSVGENGTDEGAPVPFRAGGQKLSRFGWNSNAADNAPDIVFGAAWRTAKPPATSTAPAIP